MVLTLQPCFESKQLNRIRLDNTVVTLNPSQLNIFIKFDLLYKYFRRRNMVVKLNFKVAVIKLET